MRIVILGILIFLCYTSHGQKIALLSKDFKSPILYTDSLTVEQVSSGRFAVAVSDLDTLIGSLTYLRNLLQELTRSKLQSWEFRSGRTSIQVNRIPLAYGDRYAILAVSKFDEISSTLNLSTEKNNKRNADKINRMLSYIAKNRTVLREWYEVKPKMYQVVIIGE